jgi:N-acyl-D-aspartate/D-glutamate deacylase
MRGDVLIRGGTVVDGTGGEPYRADVLVRSDRIAAVGRDLVAQGVQADRQLDATGLLVTPGFVDVHTHYDGQASWEQTLQPSSLHGVTTVVMGNCGVGFAPCRADARHDLVRLMEGIEDIPEVVMTAGVPWQWETFPEYLDFLEPRRYDVDVAAQLPHAAVRVHVMGRRGMARQSATEADLGHMRRLAREAMECGAIGFSTSRTVNHKTVDGDPTPVVDAAERELQAIASGMADAGTGVMQVITDFPTPADVPARFDLLANLVRRSGRPLSFTLAQFHSAPRSWEVVLRLLEDAHASGLPVRAQVFPRPMGMLMSLETTRNPFSDSTTYQSLASLPTEERVAAMGERTTRNRILLEAASATAPVKQRNFEWIFPLRQSSDYEPAAEDSLAAVARRVGRSPDAVAYDLLVQERAMLYAPFANLADGNLDPALAMMASPATIVGLGDGGAHYGLLCDASFPTFLLEHWGRDRTKGAKLPVAWIIRSLARDTAVAVGLLDRGLVQVGYKADLNIIDFEALHLQVPEVVYDLPSGGKRLTQRAEGYRATIVSGQVTYRDGQPTGALPGRLVRGARTAPA